MCCVALYITYLDLARSLHAIVSICIHQQIKFCSTKTKSSRQASKARISANIRFTQHNSVDTHLFVLFFYHINYLVSEQFACFQNHHSPRWATFLSSTPFFFLFVYACNFRVVQLVEYLLESNFFAYLKLIWRRKTISAPGHHHVQKSHSEPSSGFGHHRNQIKGNWIILLATLNTYLVLGFGWTRLDQTRRVIAR